MSIIFVLIPLAIIIVSLAVGVFFWAVKSNQFDDLERQGYSILFDDDIKKDDIGHAVTSDEPTTPAPEASLSAGLSDIKPPSIQSNKDTKLDD